jgi:hypothetical protein
MRRRNRRVIITGAVLLVFAIGFFLFMASIAGKSTDPVAMMQIVGEASGVVGGLALVMIVVGLIGKKTDQT